MLIILAKVGKKDEKEKLFSRFDYFRRNNPPDPKKLLEALEKDRNVDMTNAVVTYQAMIYKVEMNEDFAMYGWDYTGEILFESQVYDDPSKAVLELSFCEPSHPNWFETFRTIVEGEVIDEQIMDTSVIDFPWYGDAVSSE